MSGVNLATAKALRDDKKWQDAINVYRGCISADVLKSIAERIEAYYWLGICYDEMDKTDAALECYTAAIDFKQTDKFTGWSCYRRAIIYRNRGQYALAFTDFAWDLKLETNPDNLHISYAGRARMYHLMKLYSMEITDLAEAAKRSTDKQAVTDYCTRIESAQKLLGASENGSADLKALQERYDSLQTAFDDFKDETNDTIAELKAAVRDAEAKAPALSAADTKHIDSKTAVPVPLRLTELTAEGVVQYLRGIAPAYDVYTKKFLEVGVNGRMLCDLDDTLLKELGVNEKLHRVRILADTAKR